MKNFISLLLLFSVTCVCTSFSSEKHRNNMEGSISKNKMTVSSWKFYYEQNGSVSCDDTFNNYSWDIAHCNAGPAGASLPDYYFIGATSGFGVGTVLYTDATCTTPAPGGVYYTYGPVTPNHYIYMVGNNGAVAYSIFCY